MKPLMVQGHQIHLQNFHFVSDCEGEASSWRVLCVILANVLQKQNRRTC